MTPCAVRWIPQEDIELFLKVKKLVELLPDLDFGLDESGKPVVLSCHILARVLSKHFSLKYVDGHFAGNYEHSWLVTGNGNIIDPYPVAVIGGPVLTSLLMDGGVASPARRIYKPTSARKLSRGRFGKASFRRSVRHLLGTMRKV